MQLVPNVVVVLALSLRLSRANQLRRKSTLIPIQDAGATDHPDRVRVPPKRARPLMWFHIHKVAGTYMCNLAWAAGEHIVQPNHNCNSQKLRDGYDMMGIESSKRNDKPVSCAERASYFREQNFTWGAVEHELLDDDLCFDSFDFATLLRKPTSVIESSMNQHVPAIERLYPNEDPKLALLQDLKYSIGNASVPQWGTIDGALGLAFLDNFMTRLLANVMYTPVGQISDAHVAIAVDRLKRFKHVSTLEDWPTASAGMFRALGWSASIADLAQHKEHVRKDKKYTFTEEEKGWLQTINRYDMALYNSFALHAL